MKIKPGGLAVIVLVVAAVIFLIARNLGAGDGTTRGVPRLSGKTAEQGK